MVLDCKTENFSFNFSPLASYTGTLPEKLSRKLIQNNQSLEGTVVLTVFIEHQLFMEILVKSSNTSNLYPNVKNKFLSIFKKHILMTRPLPVPMN